MTFPITIYHYPKCGTSRNVLEMIRAAGYEPQIIDYLQTGWKTSELKELFAAMHISAHEALRTKGTLAEELGLTNADTSENTIIEAMVAHPILVNRPIVVTPKGAKLCRPAETVLFLLERAPV